MNIKKPIALLSGLVLAASLPVSAALADTATVVSKEFANVRAGAGMDAAVLTTADPGTVVEIFGANGSWTEVKLKNGIQGYIHTSLLGDFVRSATATVTAAKSANLRAGAASNAAVITTVANGVQVDVLSVSGNWTQVRLNNGTQGYIHSSLIKQNSASSPTPSFTPSTPSSTGTSTTTTPAATATTAVVTAAKSANVRAEAGHKGKVITWAMKGDTVTVLGTSGTWTHVQLKNGRKGYIHSSLLRAMGTPTGAALAVGRTAVITAPKSANLRSEASYQGKVIGWAMKGDVVTVLDIQGKWVKVQMKNGKVGYVHSSYCAG